MASFMQKALQYLGLKDIDNDGFYDDEDLDAYFSARGRETPHVERIWVGSRLPDPQSAPAEDRIGITAVLQVLGSVAPGADLAVYFAENNEMGLSDGLSRAVHDEERANAVILLTASVAEDEASPMMAQVLGDVARTAAAMGRVICVPVSADSPNLPAREPYALACAATKATAKAGAFFEWPGTLPAVGSGTYERAQWQDDAIVDRSAAPAGQSLVPDVCALGGPYGFVIDGRWASLSDDLLAAALWAGLLARIQGAVRHPWGTVPDLYQQYAPAGALVPVPHTLEPVQQGWRPAIGLGAPDGDRLLTTCRTAANEPGAVR